MKATFNNIVDQLVKVLTDKAESAQYYSDNEQYTGICGWCGIMSPESRPAYIKTFGKTTTEAAEAKAREMIAEKEAARQRTRYAQHAQEADRLEGVPAVGGFFWADNSGLKCDGGRGLFEELHALNYYTHAAEKPARLCCVEQIIKVSEADFARPELADELVTRHNLQGFSRSEDVDEDDTTYYNDPEKLATFYTVGTLVVSPSGKYYLIDSEGYDYARYIYVPIEWPVMLADEVASVKAKEEARKAEEERQAAEEKAQHLANYRKRCAKWLPLMRNVEEMEQDEKATARKIDNARKANILAMCAAAFPGVKFSVSVRRGWGADFDLTWTDGPTVEEFNEKTDLDLFCRSRVTFNGWDDSTDVIYSEFTEFADLTMGSNGGDIDAVREMSDEARAELLAQILAAVPAADNRNKYGYTEAYTYTNKEAEAVAEALGVDVFDIFAHGYTENAETIARRAWNVRSYTKTTTPEPTDPKPDKAQAANSADTASDEAPAEGLQLVDIAEGVAVVGDSRTTYRNRKAIKAHGATWNNEAKQWQATDPEAVARLRQWFGASATQTTEEADTINENDREKALFVIFAACEIGRLEWHASGYYTYTDATAEDWGDLEAVAPEVVTAWREAGNPINRNECARLFGEELTKEAEDAHTVARHRAKYCEEWRDELREIWAIYKDLTAIGKTTTDTDAHPEEQEQEQHTHTTESEQPDPQEQPEQQNAEEVERATRFAALLTDVFTMFEELATAAQAEAQRAKEAANKQAEAEQLRADIAKMSEQVAKMVETLRTMSERLATLEAEANTDSHTDSTADTGTASDDEPQRAEERPDGSKNKPETLNMLKAAARHAEQLTEVNEHTEALLARLYVLAAVGMRVRSLIERVKAIEAAHGRGYLTIAEASERYEISQEAERKAALFLTPEEFRTLYRHDPQPESRAA